LAAVDEDILMQGISKLYERIQDWDKYVDTLRHIMEYYTRA